MYVCMCMCVCVCVCVCVCLRARAPVGGVETFLDVLHRHARAAAIAFQKGQTRCRLFDQVGVEVFAHLALYISYHVLAHHGLDLLRCESPLEPVRVCVCASGIGTDVSSPSGS